MSSSELLALELLIGPMDSVKINVSSFSLNCEVSLLCYVDLRDRGLISLMCFQLSPCIILLHLSAPDKTLKQLFAEVGLLLETPVHLDLIELLSQIGPFFKCFICIEIRIAGNEVPIPIVAVAQLLRQG